MRLLNVDTLEFMKFYGSDKPRYVTASHRWLGDSSEATIKDIEKRRNVDSMGYKKVEEFAKYIRENVASVKWLWIDTCCIDQKNTAELSEAVNLMFEWYRDAWLCLAYLADVDDKSSFKKSVWFTRGWTLQELLAPQTVVFLTRTWQVIGNKGASFHKYSETSTGPGLETEIATITGISEQILHDYSTSRGLSVDDRLKWMVGRETSREEDMFYALYGIFGVTPGANYGERHEGARQRLLAAIHQEDVVAAKRADQFRKIADWFSPPDPWTNHESARQHHEPQTGAWLLQSEQYQAWKSGYGSINHLWLHGKAGCGKTILCSTAVEDIRIHCEESKNAGFAIFYFSFSDVYKQTCENLVRSLVVQLGWKEPGLSMLHNMYARPDRRLPGLDELQNILLSCLTSYNVVFLYLDALDECPEGDQVRQSVLEYITQLLQKATNIRMFATSRDISEIFDCMEQCGAKSVSIAAQTVDADIQKYISTQLSRDRRLSRLDPATRALIEEMFSQKADGMFRWVYCQLQEIKKFKSTKPKSVKAALLTLPTTLDGTYERMLINISEEDHSDALTLLRWLAYAQSPLSLGELAEATIIDPTADEVVDLENRGDWEDALDILAGLVTIEGANDEGLDYGTSRPDAVDDNTDGPSIVHYSRRTNKYSKVRLAHFSVKEYLESPRILESNAKDFHLHLAREHRFLAQSCIVYIKHYSASPEKTLSMQDSTLFPLLEYAAKSWFRHSALQDGICVKQEMSLLQSTTSLRDWLFLYQPDDPFKRHFEHPMEAGCGLYYASAVGLKAVVQEQLNTGADVNAQGGRYSNALQAAAEAGHEQVVQVLMDAGADIHAQGGDYGNALQAASSGGYEKVVRMLIAAGSDVNAQGGSMYNALQATSRGGHENVAQILIDAGADVHARGKKHDISAPQTASTGGYEKLIRALILAGVYANVQEGDHSNALQAASFEGQEEVVRILIDAGANVDAKGGIYTTALQAASCRGYEKVVQSLMDAGANVNAGGGIVGRPLQAASVRGDEKVVQMLIDAGAEVNAQGGSHGNALQGASLGGNENIVQMLIERGANVNAQGGRNRNALQAASLGNHEKVVRMLIDAGADVNAQGGRNGNALQAASWQGNGDIVQMLIDRGADVNAQGGRNRNALQAASLRNHETVVQILIDAGADALAEEVDQSNSSESDSSKSDSSENNSSKSDSSENDSSESDSS